MAVFTIIWQPTLPPAQLEQAIAAAYPEAHLSVIADRVWLVAHSGSAQDLATKLGVTDGSNGAALVLEVGGYFGRANPNIWTWIKAKWEATSGAQGA